MYYQWLESVCRVVSSVATSAFAVVFTRDSASVPNSFCRSWTSSVICRWGWEIFLRALK